MKKIITLVISLSILISSCSVNINQTINGWWSIDSIYYKNYDIKPCLIGNSLEFDEEDHCTVPIVQERCEPLITKSYSKDGVWKIIKSESRNDTIPFRMDIISSNEIFRGTHKIVFYKDSQNKLLKMEIFSKDLYIICRKGLFDFDKNIKTINELEKISWIRKKE